MNDVSLNKVNVSEYQGGWFDSKEPIISFDSFNDKKCNLYNKLDEQEINEEKNISEIFKKKEIPLFVFRTKYGSIYERYKDRMVRYKKIENKSYEMYGDTVYIKEFDADYLVDLIRLYAKGKLCNCLFPKIKNEKNSCYINLCYVNSDNKEMVSKNHVFKCQIYQEPQVGLCPLELCINSHDWHVGHPIEKIWSSESK